MMVVMAVRIVAVVVVAMGGMGMGGMGMRAVVVMAVTRRLGGIGRGELMGEHAGEAGNQEAEERQEDDQIIHVLSPSSR